MANQLGMFGPLDFWTIVAAVLAVILLGSTITHRSITTLPFVLAMVYFVLRNQELVPWVAAWVIMLAAGLTSAGIGLLFPQKYPQRANFVVGTFVGDDDDDDEEWDEDDRAESEHRRERARRKMGGIDNNPSVNVNFGSVSRYLNADSLETVSLSCNFGGIDLYFDQVELSPNGATVHLDCKFGGIDIYVPRHWQINEQINCILGGADVNNRKLCTATESSPQLTITGNVLCGGVDIYYI